MLPKPNQKTATLPWNATRPYTLKSARTICIYDLCSPEPICFYKVKAHSDIAGNEFADAIAKHSALHDGGHDMHFQPPAPDGNAHTHLYWLAAKDTDENPNGRGAATPRLCALSDLKAKLKTGMCKLHRLGSAKTDTGYYNYWKDLRPLVNKHAKNASGTIIISNSTKSVML
jgi:hypothetical protein